MAIAKHLLWLGLGAVCIAHAAPPLEVYGALAGIENVSLSPSGGEYAFVAVVGEARRLAVVTTDGKVLFVAGVGSLKVRDVYWVGDDHVLVETSSTFSAPLDFRQDYELATVTSINVKTGKSMVVFGGSEGIANAVFGKYGEAFLQDHWYGYFGGVTYARTLSGSYTFEHGFADLYRVDLDAGSPKRVVQGSELNPRWVLGADGEVLAHSEYSDKTGLWQLFAGSQHGQLLMEVSSPLRQMYLLGQGRTAQTALVLDQTGDRDVLEEVTIADGKRQSLLDDRTITQYLPDPEGRLIGALTKEEPGAVFFEPRLQARYNGTRKAFPGLQVELESYSRNLDRLIVKTDGSHDSGTYWMVDIASGKADVIGRPYPLIHDADVGAVQRFHYSAGDGLAIEAILTLPPGREPKNLPLVVLPHGGPIDEQDDPGFDWWAQAYASRGYAVLQPNYRGSSGYDSAFRKAGFGQWGRKMQTDLSDGVAALAKEGTIDAGRVCIVGASYGGYAALAGVTLQQGIYRCAVAVAGPADLASFFRWQIERHGYDSDDTRYWRAVVGADKDGNGVMATLSPAQSAARADAPILLIHGKDDTVVPIEQSEAMAAALKKAGKPYDYVVMKGEDHWLSRGETRTTMLKAAVAFVERYNPAQRP